LDHDQDDRNPGPPGPGPHSSIVPWELAKLIGNYERFTKEVDRKLTGIDERLEKSQETFTGINTVMATRAEQLDNIDNRLVNVEDNGGLSKRRRWQVDGTTLAAVALTVKEIVAAIVAAL